jgi:hypothetical protein
MAPNGALLWPQEPASLETHTLPTHFGICYVYEHNTMLCITVTVTSWLTGYASPNLS